MKTQTIAVNRKAYHDYHILDSVEAGLVLTGTEIKSVRGGKVNLREAYARPEGGELWLLNAHIAPYDAGNRHNHEALRPRKLLLHRQQIYELSQKIAQKGLTLVPLKLYIKDSLAKVEVGLARGKRVYDKRQTMISREAERELDRARKFVISGR
ncbi:MAG: SsrA-binding protein SmpB [Chloroflexi bacterium]|nr:SsrA-binding protein SmpB [Chloroflexota bacterium]